MEVNLILLDIDGCLYRTYHQLATPNSASSHKNVTIKDYPTEKWIALCNEVFFQRRINQIKTAAYAKVILAHATNRQDNAVDRYNAKSKGTGTMAPALPVMQSYLQNHLDCKIVIDPMLTGDIY